jgi:hypothetical protein
LGCEENGDAFDDDAVIGTPGYFGSLGALPMSGGCGDQCEPAKKLPD